MDIIDLSLVKKSLVKVPKDIIRRLQRWIKFIESIGLIETRKIPGFHDEPLKGDRKGQRSVRLNKQWRVIYTMEINGSINIIKIEEITPHDY